MLTFYNRQTEIAYRKLKTAVIRYQSKQIRINFESKKDKVWFRLMRLGYETRLECHITGRLLNQFSG